MSVSSPTSSTASQRTVVAVLAAAVATTLSGGLLAAVRYTGVPSTGYLGSSIGAAGQSAQPSPPAAAVPVVAPVRIDIPRLGVSAPVDAIGLHDDHSIAVPEAFDRTGWYSGLEAPGQVGTAVIVGHLDSHTGPAVFFKVPELGAGDAVVVALADGSTVPFVVERTERYRKLQFPTIAVYSRTDRPTLRLITCGGTFDKKSRSYSDNVVVYASAQEAT